MTSTIEAPDVEDTEEVEDPPPPPPARTFARRMVLPLLVGCVIRVIFGLIDDVPSVDESTYLSSGVSWWEGNGYRTDGLPALHFPPLVPFVLGGVAELTGDAHEAQVIVTIIAGTLLLLPLAGVARTVAGDSAGIAAAWAGALGTALIAEVANRGGGSEAPYTLLVMTALWVVTLIRPGPIRRTVAISGLAGLVTGLAYLARPEGLWFGGAFAVAVGLRTVGGWRRLFRPVSTMGRAAASSLAFVVVLGAVAAPYVSYLHDKTGDWKLTAKTQDASLAAWRAVAEGDRRARDEVLYDLDDTGLAFSAERYPLTQLIKEDPAGYASLVAVNVRQLGYYLVVPDREFVWHWRLIPLPLLLAALWAAWKRRRDPTALLLMVTGLIPVATALAFFVLGRYLVVTATVLYAFVGIAYASIAPSWQRRAAWGSIALLGLSAFAALWGPGGFLAPREPLEQRMAGEWLEQNTSEDTRLMARSQIVAFYSERRTVALPYASPAAIQRFGRHFGAEYLIADEFILWEWRPQLRYLFGPGPWKGLRLVHEEEHEGRVVRIFAFDPPPERSAERQIPTLAHAGDGSPKPEGGTEKEPATSGTR